MCLLFVNFLKGHHYFLCLFFINGVLTLEWAAGISHIHDLLLHPRLAYHARSLLSFHLKWHIIGHHDSPPHFTTGRYHRREYKERKRLTRREQEKPKN